MPSTSPPGSRRRTLLLYFHTLRYLRLRQVFHRLLFAVRFFLYRKYPLLCRNRHTLPKGTPPALTGVLLLKGLRQMPPWPPFPDRDEILTRSDRLLRNEFLFLNHPHDFGERIDWHCASVSHLWRYQLHYFDYALDLGLAYRVREDHRYYEKFRELVESWLDQNPPGRLDGWHPYTISRRVVNWVYAYELFGPAISADEDFSRRFLRALYQQCHFLSRHLEYQGYGNHLLANLKALIFGGLFFRGRTPERWLETGLRLLAQELDEQILRDGGHFERSPMYHLIVMKDLVECLSALRNGGQAPPPWLVRKLRDMTRFTEAVRTPDGRIPLFNDSAHDMTPNPDELVGVAGHLCGQGGSWTSRAFSSVLLGVRQDHSASAPSDESPSSAALEESGYFILRGGRGMAVYLDCGPVCPDYLPPHAHADTLSYDLWVGGVNLVSDSGVCEYTAGAWRDFFRSSRAHNTVVVDGEDQSEVWGSFRVARRAYPRDVVWLSTGEGAYFSGGHDGYLRLRDPVLHHRRVVHVRERFWLVLDQITGRGEHRAESFVHLHPDAQAVQTSAGTIRISCGGKAVTLRPSGCDRLDSCRGRADPLQGWYSPAFGVKRPRQTFCLTKTGSVPFFLGYVLAIGEVSEVSFSYQIGDREQYEVRLDGARWLVEVCPTETRLRVRQEGRGL